MSHPTSVRALESSTDGAGDRTAIAVDLETAYTTRRNLAWSAALALAWKELIGMAGGPIALAGPDDAGATIARALNASGVDSNVVDEASCVARAGLQTVDFLRELRAEIADKLGDASPRYVPSEPAPDLFIAYALLQKRLAFEVPLLRGSSPLYFQRTFVESFGLWHRDPEEWAARSGQVRVHHPCYTEADVERMTDAEYDAMYDEFVVELITKQASDRLVVASVRRGDTLGDTAQRAMSFLDRHGADHPHARLGVLEKLEIPILDLDLARRYGELYGRSVDNPRLAGQRFGEVVERVRFRLDEGGALLHAEGVMRGLCLPPRELVFQGPFLVMVLRRAARVPMFALWVDNTEVMVEVEEPEDMRRMKKRPV
jgi:hypothetical protein